MDLRAKTRRQLQGLPDEPAKPGESLPSADGEGLAELGATHTWPRVCEYRHPKHTLANLMRPGYFEGETRSRMHIGDEIHFTMYGGHKSPLK